MTKALCGLLALIAITACGSGDDDDGDGSPIGSSAKLNCEEGRYLLAGTIDGEEVTTEGDVGGHSWIQLGETSTFDVTLLDGGTLSAEWPDLVADGESTTIEGSITLPSGGAHALRTFDAGHGTLVKSDETVRFELYELTESVQCINPPCTASSVEGGLAGCVRWEDF